MTLNSAENHFAIPDLDWFGVDSVGHVAHFTMAEHGALPDNLVNREDELKVVTDYFYELAPKLGTSINNHNANAFSHHNGGFPVNYNDYRLMSEKGLFSYDAQEQGVAPRSYDMMFMPSVPLTIGSVNEDIKNILLKNTFKNILFSKSLHVSVEIIHGCSSSL